MAFTKQELYEKLIATYATKGLQGELVELVSDLLSEYLYLHQMEDVSILMEDSFLRCKYLNSSIQHAADNFYSVDRGKNRLIHINNLGCLSPVRVSKFDTVSSYGQYKLVYDQNYTHLNTDEPFEFSGYLTIDNAQTITVEGNGRYYMDLTDAEGNLIQNVSENIMVMSIDDRGTADNRDDKHHEFKISNNLLDLYTKAENATIGSEDQNDDSISVMKAEICAMTLPNYGIRLWKADKFQENFTYVIKYLKCPDETKAEINIETDIRSIPGYTKNANKVPTEIKVVEKEDGSTCNQVLKTEDQELIYLNAAANSRFQGAMKSINSIDDFIQSNLSKDFNLVGFKTVIGPKTNPFVEDGAIKVYCTFTGHEGATQATLKSMQIRAVNLLKAYYITNDIVFENAQPVNMTNTVIDTEGSSQILYVDVHYNDIIEYAVCENIVDNKRYIVGEDFNPYQIIADMMSHEQLQGRLSLVEVYWKNGNTKIYPSPTKLSLNQCIKFKAKINYISNR
ncbi:MAG: hypothetical protein MJZ34_02940 [Paludibacteraceae bacterium]|nr:hypothetical protein [Paludibacteraceae bacterium]